MSRKRYLTPVLLLIASLSILSAAGTAEKTSIPVGNGPVYTDSYQRIVHIPEDVDSVISLGPNITEMIFSLDKGDLLVGRTDYCDYPAEISSIPSVGSITEPNLETIIELQPDIVIGSAHTPKAVLDRIEEAGITTVGIYTDQSIEGIFKTIADTAFILDAQARGQQITEEMRSVFSGVREAVSGLEQPTVYYVVGFGEWGDFTAGGDTYIDELITLAGGDNIASDIRGWSYSLEMLIEQDPDIIICSKYWGTREAFSQTPGYRDLTAVKEGRLYEIDNNRIDRQGVRNASGLLELAEIFHPGSM